MKGGKGRGGRTGGGGGGSFYVYTGVRKKWTEYRVMRVKGDRASGELG